MELQKKLDAIRLDLGLVSSCTWSDPGEHCIQPSKKYVSEGGRITKTDNIDCTKVKSFENNNEVVDDSTEWLSNVVSDEEIVDDNDETILLQSSEVVSVRKGMKYRIKKILYCCAPCIKSKAV